MDERDPFMMARKMLRYSNTDPLPHDLWDAIAQVNTNIQTFYNDGERHLVSAQTVGLAPIYLTHQPNLKGD